MFSFFKPKVSAAEYCKTRLNLMFSPEQARLWNRLRSESSYLSISKFFFLEDDSAYLDEMLAAHLQLLSLAINKKYRDIELYAAVHTCIEGFLKERGREDLNLAKDAYNKAFGKISDDGVRKMATLLSRRVVGTDCSEGAISELCDYLYSSLASIYADFEKIKLTRT